MKKLSKAYTPQYFWKECFTPTHPIHIGAVHRRPHKITKKWSPSSLSKKCPYWLTPSSLTVWTHHKFRKIRSFLHQKGQSPHLNNPLVRKLSALVKVPLLSDCGSLLWIAPYVFSAIDRACFLKQKFKPKYT